jgi:3-oxoacyl-[acyl-carrier protein] reductase
MNQIDLKGRVAVVTGGAQGIGYAVAGRMLDSGAAVALWDVDAPRLARAKETLGAPGRLSTHTLDLVDEAAVAAATEARLAAHVSIYINV